MLPRGSLLTVVLIALAAVAVPSLGGDVAPGDGLDLSRWKGKVVLLDFWASWCAPCLESFPWMDEMQQRYGDAGLVVIAVNLDEDPSAAEAFLSRGSFGFEHVRDPEGILARRFGVTTMPHSILFDREGRAAYRHAGFRAAERADYERHVVELLDSAGTVAALEIEPVSDPKLGVQPWERGALAAIEMQMLDSLELEFDEHIYFSKEASSGGRGFGGGGCGCN